MYNHVIYIFYTLCLRVQICICICLFRVSKVSSFFFLLLSYSFFIISTLCCLEDFGMLKHPNIESFCYIIVVAPKRIS
jgi:hypothetical protein